MELKEVKSELLPLRLRHLSAQRHHLRRAPLRPYPRIPGLTRGLPRVGFRRRLYSSMWVLLSRRRPSLSPETLGFLIEQYGKYDLTDQYDLDGEAPIASRPWATSLGSCTTFPSRPCQGVKLVGFAAKANNRTRVRPFKITAFKCKAQTDESRQRENGSNGGKEGITAFPAMHRLFKEWMNMLSSVSRTRVAEQTVDDELPRSRELLQTETARECCENVGTSKSIWSRFLELDASIKIPITIFIPLFLAVNTVYGPEVSKELTPLWILGPLVVASYAKMLQGLCKLYVFIFRLAIKLITSLPDHYRVTYSFVSQGKLQEYTQARLVRPIAGLKDLDYKELSRKEMKRVREWFAEKYLDFVECIWPYYCRTIRFLKKAHFI